MGQGPPGANAPGSPAQKGFLPAWGVKPARFFSRRLCRSSIMGGTFVPPGARIMSLALLAVLLALQPAAKAPPAVRPARPVRPRPVAPPVAQPAAPAPSAPGDEEVLKAANVGTT